jgi:predicted RNase H-like HicB family nuclease
MLYPIIIHKESKSSYGVIVPDLPGCFSAGETLDEALANSREAIVLWMEMAIDDGNPIPKPGTLEKFQKNPEYSDAHAWAVVEINPAELPTKAVRVDITVQEQVLGKIDRFVKKSGTNRSNFLVDAALEKMAREGMVSRKPVPKGRSSTHRKKVAGRH